MTTEAPAATTPVGTSPNGQAAQPPAAGGTPATPAPEQKSTVEKLFPDFIGKDGKLMDKPNVVLGPNPGDSLDPTPVVDKGAQPPAPAPAAPAAPQYVDLNALEGKMVKLKVDGVEIDVPATSLVKNYQLEAHLTQKGQRLADQERILQEVLKDAVTKGKPTGTPPAAATEPDPNAPPADPELAKVQAELKRTQAELAETRELTKDLRVQKGLKAIADDIRANTGADDFLTYAPKIMELAKTKCKDPMKPTPEEIALYDSPLFYKTTYLEMKTKDMLAGKTPPPTPAPAAPAAQPPANPGVESRPAPNISVETGAGSPAVDRTGSDWNTRYKAALQKATTTGDLNDWAEVNRLKHEPVGSR